MGKAKKQNLSGTQGMIPELRFPEFEGDGEWELKPLEEVAKINTGNKDTQDKIDDGKYPFFVRSQTIERINSYSFEGEAILTSGDGVGVGKIYHYIIGKFDYHQRVYCIYDFDKDVEGKFIFYFFSEHFYQRVMQLSAKNSVDSVRRAMITEMPIALPSRKKEQQKIASCLSSLDELIAAHNDKLDALKDHKKGLLQNLFPDPAASSGGETVPKVRFPEFEGDGEWVEDTLGKRGAFTGGGTPSKSKLEYWNGDFPWVSSSDIDEESIHRVQITRFITEDAIKESATKIVPSNSLLIVSRVGVGKVAFSKEEICTSQDFSSFTPQKDDPIFLGYYLKSNKNILLSFSQGMAIKGFTKDDISGLRLCFPSNEEQQKIASCLAAVDELIMAQQEKIEQLQQHKKGLMQGLFPKMSE